MAIRIGILTKDNDFALVQNMGFSAKVPDGYEKWQPALDALFYGLAHMAEQEKRQYGQPVLAQAFSRYGMFLVADREKLGHMTSEGMRYRHGGLTQFISPEDGIVQPAIAVNRRSLEASPELAPYLVGHEGAHFFNYPRSLMDPSNLMRLLAVKSNGKQAYNEASVHAGSDLFSIAFNLDFVKPHNDSLSLHEFIRIRTGIKVTHETIGYLQHEAFADAVAIEVSGGLPKFPEVDGAFDALKYRSDFVSQFVQTIVVADMALSADPSPAAKRHHQAFQRQMLAPFPDQRAHQFILQTFGQLNQFMAQPGATASDIPAPLKLNFQMVEGIVGQLIDQHRSTRDAALEKLRGREIE